MEINDMPKTDEPQIVQSSTPMPCNSRSIYGTLAREAQANQAKHTAQPNLLLQDQNSSAWSWYDMPNHHSYDTTYSHDYPNPRHCPYYFFHQQRPLIHSSHGTLEREFHTTQTSLKKR
jgi:hypothetical protein